jgi:hypothetical protein
MYYWYDNFIGFIFYSITLPSKNGAFVCSNHAIYSSVNFYSLSFWIKFYAFLVKLIPKCFILFNSIITFSGS